MLFEANFIPAEGNFIGTATGPFGISGSTGFAWNTINEETKMNAARNNLVFIFN